MREREEVQEVPWGQLVLQVREGRAAETEVMKGRESS